jgi:hypothetical protein
MPPSSSTTIKLLELETIAEARQERKLEESICKI